MATKISAAPLALLHIDDNPNDRFFLQQAARRAKIPLAIYDADGAQSAAPYFAIWHADSRDKAYATPSLVLLDYDMGDHNGVDFLHWLRLVRKAETPVVMLTGTTDEAVVRDCYAAGANHFLVKPDSVDRVQEIIVTLHQCMSSNPRQFAPLAALPEYKPNPVSKPMLPAAVSPKLFS